MSAKISVIVPIYNVEDYLVRCLDSLVSQTLKDIEIICINDGSTDNSLEILNAYAQRDNRIIVINKKNEGQGIARNIGLSKASGEYVSFIDPDDWILSEMYEEMYNQALNLSSEIVICDYIRYQSWNDKHWVPKLWKTAISSDKAMSIDITAGENIDKNLVYKSLLVSPCYSWNRIYKTELLRANSIKFSEHRCYEDVLFIFKSHISAKSISYINKPFYIYYLNDKSTLHSLNKRYYFLIDVYENLVNYIELLDLSYSFKTNLSYFIVSNLAWVYKSLPESEQKNSYNIICAKLDKEEVASFKNIIKRGVRYRSKEFLKYLFSVTNTSNHKVFNFGGLKIKFRYLKGSKKLEQFYIDKIKKNQKKYQKDTYVLFDCLNGDISECIDAYSLFCYMREIGFNAYYVLMKQTSLYKELEAKKELDYIIGLEQPTQVAPEEFLGKLYPILLKTKAIITAFSFYSKETCKFFKENPYWKFIFIQHGVIFLKESVMLDNCLYSDKFDKVLISGDVEYRLFKKYKWQDDKFIKCGLPRWDLLPKSIKQKEKSIFIMFTWRRLDCLSFDTSLYKQNILSLINSTKLHKYLQEHDVKVYFALHHALYGLQKIEFSIDNPNICFVDSSDISKYVKICSCLITDFSSLAFDFMFQNKPVISYLLDYNDSTLHNLDRKDMEVFDYKKYIFPNVTYTEDELIEKIKYYVERDFELEPDVKEKYDKFFYIKENIREDLTKKITEICS